MSRLRNVPGARDVIAQSRFCVTEPKEFRGKWDTVFGSKNPIRVEIGMGKGKFLMRQAVLHPEINYVGIEMYSSVLVRAIEKAEELSTAGLDPGNFRFIRMDARELAGVFEKGEIERIYLNFSDPWPKERHAKRRLTSEGFLNLYDELLPDGSVLEFKTDNTDLFAFSLEEAKRSRFTVKTESWDLYSDPELLQDNVPTEYEEKFVEKGNKICKMVLSK